MLFVFALFGYFCCEVCVNAASEPHPPYLTDADFMRAAKLEPELTALNFSRPDTITRDKADPETRLAWRYTRWPNAIVPYTLDPGFDQNQRTQVATAMANYHSKTCVRFVPKNDTHKDYVNILRDDNTCGLAELCVRGGAQFAKFGGSCITSGVMAHELGHTLCFMHEQTRPDADDYITWDKSKCTPHDKVSANDWTTLDLLYDYVSLQHYEGECYNGCITPKQSGVKKCGSGGPLSVLDIEKINAYYECPGCNSYKFKARSLITYSANDQLVVAGTGRNGESLYPCRAYYNGDIIPGKGDPYGSCYVSYNGAERRIDSKFEVLSNPKNANLVWRQYTAGSPVPANAIAGGRDAERNTMYIGRCSFTDQSKTMIIPGKFHPGQSSKLYIPYGGREYTCEPFELLVCQ